MNIDCGITHTLTDSQNPASSFFYVSNTLTPMDMNVIYGFVPKKGCVDINVVPFFVFVSLQRAKRCTRDRCCQSLPSPWQSASWGPCVWPSTAATSEKLNTQITLTDIRQDPGTYVSLCKVTVDLVQTHLNDPLSHNQQELAAFLTLSSTSLF